MKRLACVVLTTLVTCAAPAIALDARDLGGLVGFTMVEVTSLAGTFEGGPDYYGRVVRLSNGWVFDCQSYLYNYSHKPGVAVFAKKADYRYRGREVVFYKLVIDDKIYDASRVE